MIHQITPPLRDYFEIGEDDQLPNTTDTYVDPFQRTFFLKKLMKGITVKDEIVNFKTIQNNEFEAKFSMKLIGPDLLYVSFDM